MFFYIAFGVLSQEPTSQLIVSYLEDLSYVTPTELLLARGEQ